MPRAKVASVQQVSSTHFDSNVRHFQRALEQIFGEDRHFHLAAAKLRPARLAQLVIEKPAKRPLRWSELTDKQAKELEAIAIFRGPDDLVWYGDTVVVWCPKGEWEQEQRRKATEAMARSNIDMPTHGLDREMGVRVEDGWEDLPSSAAPRS